MKKTYKNKTIVDKVQYHREKSRQWRASHPQYMTEYMKKYRNRKDGKWKQFYQMWYNINIKRTMLRNALHRAKTSNQEFNITEQDIIIPKKCPIYNIPLVISHNGNSDNSPTLDRIIPTRGYVKGNIQVISKRANMHKNDATLQEVLMLAKWARRTLKSLKTT